MTCAVVTTGSRLHFGLTRVCADEGAKYSGVGVMVESPRTCLRLRQVDQPVQDASGREAQFANHWLDYLRSQSALKIDDVSVEIEAVELPAGHSGLGSGTQLAQATAAGINRLLGLPRASVVEVARVLDRGQRSFIGTLGFEHGGMIVDRPMIRVTETDSNRDCLAARLSLPEEWRVVMIHSPAAKRTFGKRERALFFELGKRPCPEARTLELLIENQLLPAASARDYVDFCEAVYEYGWLSGQYYREIQGGPYNGPVVSRIVEDVRRLGVVGVGQSSWGPVVFAWCSDQDQAAALAAALGKSLDERSSIAISRARNLPAEIELS